MMLNGKCVKGYPTPTPGEGVEAESATVIEVAVPVDVEYGDTLPRRVIDSAAIEEIKSKKASPLLIGILLLLLVLILAGRFYGGKILAYFKSKEKPKDVPKEEPDEKEGIV